jgi:hypothetical protein
MPHLQSAAYVCFPDFRSLVSAVCGTSHRCTAPLGPVARVRDTTSYVNEMGGISSNFKVLHAIHSNSLKNKGDPAVAMLLHVHIRTQAYGRIALIMMHPACPVTFHYCSTNACKYQSIEYTCQLQRSLLFFDLW